MSVILSALQHQTPLLVSGAVMIAVAFLVARVLRLPQHTALALALSPMAFVLAFERAILPGLLAAG